MYHHEPVEDEASNTNEDTLIADLCVRGVWQPQCDALFNIHVIDTDALSSADKKRKYQEACLA